MYMFMLLDSLSFYRLTQSLLIVHAKWTLLGRNDQEIIFVCCTCAWQVHFEGGTVAQIVYSGDQTDRGQQQVVYTADGNSFTSVESGEHTLVYIHPADGTQVRRV